VSAWSFARATLLNPRSPACLWRHPLQAGRLVVGGFQNTLLAWRERWPGAERHACPVCGWHGRHFRTFLSADEVIPRCICPGCGSFDRHRHLVLGVRDELDQQLQGRPRIILAFSLSPAMRLLLEREGLPRCFRSDIAVGDCRFAPDFISDLRSVGIVSESIDWIFCSHVLEHVVELDVCLAEMMRLLRPGGMAWIQVPCEPDLVHSHRIEIDPERAHAHAWRFGYDFRLLLERVAWGVEEIVAADSLDRAILRYHGIDPTERFWIARKV
jgi:SAM-dependent methyltransferase